ncbi:hypothetical protein GCM10010193_53370 [Kitasatospora atroaurantiaca]|uniref:non-specific serine/threonine protein kinase n=1 Tax=Kitasatospora atroaurantiaca TaxID=285545 RepID=A0A561EQ75_9ACTN|nr:serine/threonine-protein kinase [Kitasatospora atroaurantiaca]TWE17773.1 serine/threonine protein kinase [Kitasatospora atroaurantiaca]
MGVQDQSAQARGDQRVLAGRYTLGERLGRGGMGTVWRARDEMLDREVAVKELTVSHLPEEELEILQSRMKREARAAARIKHPGVITIHDVLEQDGRPWIVMELIDGRSLADVISQDGTLLPREAAEVGAQVLAALHRGHQLGVLHRDVKPANVLLEHGTGRVVLLDFGIATFEGSSELTRPGDLVGSPDYLAPERAQGERPGPASDLWGLGATLYAAVEGESPFRRTSPLTTLAAVVGDPLPEPRRAGALGPVLAALMAKDPAERPSADEALRMLSEVTAGHTMGIKAAPKKLQKVPTQVVPVVDRTEPAAPAAEPQPTAATVVAPRRKRRTGLRVAIVGLVVAVLAGGGAYAVRTVIDRARSEHPSTVTTDGPGTTAPGPAPSGYQWVDDPAGFRFPVPVEGKWVRTTDDNSQIFYSPDNRIHYLQFAVTVGQSLSPREHFEQMEETVSRSLKEYVREDLSDTKVHGQEGAVWEFTYTAKDGSRRHAKEAEFRDEDGTSYAIYLSCPDTPKDWTTGQRRFTTVFNNFTPTR